MGSNFIYVHHNRLIKLNDLDMICQKLSARNSKHAGMAINHIFEHDCIELLFTYQIDQNAWIEIAVLPFKYSAVPRVSRWPR